MRGRTARAGADAAPDLPIGSGDDCAVAELSGAVVIGVDALVEDVHFRRSAFPARSIGSKALAAALSDLAAMGAEARHAYVQLGVPDDLGDEAALELAEGMGALAARAGVAIAGGDVTRAGELFLAVTVVGTVESAGAAVTRAGARPGDVIAVTGELGGAAAGLVLLEDPSAGAGLERGLSDALRRRQLEPEPRLAAGRALAAAGAHAMIDLSDGLAGDAGHLARASGAGIRIDVGSVPVAAGVAEVAARTGRDARELVVSGGEDYELLVALPPEALAEARAALGDLGMELTAIGKVEPGERVRFRSGAGDYRPGAGFDQLRPPSGRDVRA